MRYCLGASVLAATAASLLFLNACGNTKGSGTIGATPKIKHVVIIFQENRTPDNLFQDPVLITRSADIAQSGIDSKGNVIPLAPGPLANSYDNGHTHHDFLVMYDNGKMDGADRVTSCKAGSKNCPPHPQFIYVQTSDVQPYFQMAEQYTFADRMFQTNQGPSLPAHQYIISGTSAPAAASNLFEAENEVIPNGGVGTGCLAPPNAFVRLIDPMGNENQTMYPCLEHPTLMDLLKPKNITWRYYAISPGTIWTAPSSIQHMCGPNNPPPNATACLGSDFNNVIFPQSAVLNDIAAGRLADVSWVTPDGADSDHAGTNQGRGPSWVAAIVNAIGTSPYWQDTAILITWDDWGGWYDHVAPSIINSYEYGFRVPLIVVSPYAKPGHISHVTHDFGSILKFVEQTYGLPSLGYADTRADDLSDCFNFQQPPIVFKTIAAPVGASYFLNRTNPPVDPDDE